MKGPRLTKRQIVEAERMIAEGATIAGAARAVGRNANALYAYFRRASVVEADKTEVPPHVLRDRDRRASLTHTTLTAAICGDPLR